MSNPNIRLYLPDVIHSDNTEEILDMLTEISNKVRSAKLYFWYDEPDLKPKELKDFVNTWESKGHTNFKTIIRPYYFDTQNDFIWYDLMSYKMRESLTPNAHGITNMYTRFSWRYVNPNDILEGLQEFINIYKFVIDEKPNKKQQKRNDGKDSNHRVA